MEARLYRQRRVVPRITVSSLVRRRTKSFSPIDRAERRDRTRRQLLPKVQLGWKYRLGYGYYAGIYPKEITEAPNGGAGNWQNACGTGPFRLTRYEAGAFGIIRLTRKVLGPRDESTANRTKIPFVDKPCDADDRGSTDTPSRLPALARSMS